MCTESTKIQRKGLSNQNFTHKVNGHRGKALTKDSLFLVSQLHLREFLNLGIQYCCQSLIQPKETAMHSDTLNLCSLFISLMTLCAHKYRNSTRVKKRSFIVILNLVYDFEALCLIYLMYIIFDYYASVTVRNQGISGI